jgi:hypothetical protein
MILVTKVMKVPFPEGIDINKESKKRWLPFPARELLSIKKTKHPDNSFSGK